MKNLFPVFGHPGRVRPLLLLLALVALLLAGRAARAQAVTFNFTGNQQSYTVPANTYFLQVAADGALGGGPNGLAGRPAHLEATVAVTPGEVLTVMVGGTPLYTIDGGYNGGGNGDFYTQAGGGSGGGGGATALRRAPGAGTTGDYDGSRNALLVAAGGGGSGFDPSYRIPLPGGLGGGPDGSSGFSIRYPGGGRGATQAGPGYGYGSGSAGQGGSYAPFASGSFEGGGGGGGGGYYGGGAGEAGGGGGGSSWILPTATSPVYGPSTVPDNGQLTITPVLGFAISSFSPPSGDVGTVVELTGAGFLGATGVDFNGTAAAQFVVVSDNTIRAEVAAGSTTGPITVTAGAATATSASSFIVRASFTTVPTAPVPNALAVDRAMALTLAFGQAPTAASVASIRVFSDRYRGRRTLQSAVSGNTVTLTPNAPFRPGEVVRVSVPADVASSSGAAATPFVYQFTTAVAGTGRGSFVAPATNADAPVGSSPTSLALGDVDGDGDLDLLTANFNDNAVSVRLNNGRGSFGTRSDYATGAGPAGIALGDVDGDGDLDLLTANFDNNTVSVRLNNGQGSFVPPAANAEPAVGTTPQALTLGDVDADGDLDLLAANFNSNTVSVRLNDGQGSFTAPAANAEPAVGAGPISVALGDVDGDGDLDLLAANQLDYTVSVRLNNGQGSFTAPAGSTDIPVGSYPGAVTLGDIDGDGDLDLLTANTAGNTVSVRLNDGQGSFAPPAANADPTVGSGPSSVALGDVDADGDLDLLTSNQYGSSVSVRLNDGQGSFAPPAADAESGVGNTPVSVALGDVDGDGDLDLLTANQAGNSMSVRLNGGTGVPLPVELTAFTATANGANAVRLAWATASEKNSAAFEVERSANGRTFARIGTVAAAGSSSSARAYELTDPNPPTHQSTLYYRLKQVDTDGTFSYSPVRTVALKGVAEGLALYPNPTHGGAATLMGAQPGAVVTVFDALGRPVADAAATADAAGTAVLVMPAGLPAGVYVVRTGSKALRLTVE